MNELCGILLVACQQLRCVVCCAPVCSHPVKRSPTVSLHRHFVALSGVYLCFHTTWQHLKICMFDTLPSEQLHQLYQVAFVQAFYILQPHD